MKRLITILCVTNIFCTVMVFYGCGGESESGESESIDGQNECYSIPFATVGDYLGVWDGNDYRPIFVKGFNLGVGIPGTSPGELAISRDQYRRWFQRMSEAGANSIRIYTLHYPRFYEVLYEHNISRPEDPLYIMHGVWLDEENPTGNLLNMTEGFDASIEEVIDCVHGNRLIEHRYGRAYGNYDVDISCWVVGWLIGREISPFEVIGTNDKNPELISYEGKTLRLPVATPAEVWATERIDHVVYYERENYGVERPVGWSSWPTLDPLTHPTESSDRDEDVVSIDLANIDPFDAPAGYFVSFHAYPYYPDFMNEDPGYREFSDYEGPNSYLGYLYDLKAHYNTIPLLIGEFSVPSSWGNAHFAHSGMHHGGFDEIQQGKYNARQLKNIHEAGCAGGQVFAWMDEWWKPCWLTQQWEMPYERRRLWHNVTNPEQNYGFIAFDLGPPDFNQWDSILGEGRISEVRAAADAAFFHLRIGLDPPLSQGEILTIGYDTYLDERGESVLPDGVKTDNRSELALVITVPDKAQLYVTEAYDLYGIWHWAISSDKQQYHSTLTNGAPWVPVRWLNSDEHGSDDGEYWFQATFQEIGRLRIRDPYDSLTSLDAVVIDEEGLEVRIPWSLLQFTDPSRLEVMDDDRNTPAREIREIAVSEGIAVSISLYGDLIESGRYRWEPWEEAPPTTEREKPSLEIFSATMRAITDPP